MNDPTPLQALRATSAAPLDRAHAMPKSVYTSPEFAALEQTHIFAADWLCAGRADALPDHGDYLTITIAGEPVIVLRDGTGILRAMSLRRDARESQRAGDGPAVIAVADEWTSVPLRSVFKLPE